jgi:hypothetical protein
MTNEYNTSRGGYAPDEHRQAFYEAVNNPSDRGWSSPEGKRLIGQLWNCIDRMPGMLCEDLDLPHGSIYAKGARKL